MKNIKTITSLILFLKITALSSFGSPHYTDFSGGKLANVDMQNMLQKMQQTLQMMSNISKTLHDVASAVIRKLSS